VIRLFLLATAVFGFMTIEAIRAASNERAQRARGGIEPKADVYPFMQVAYPGVFIAMIAEGWLRASPPPTSILAAGILIFAAGKLLKWSAIRALGQSWTFRVIVVPGTTLVRAGPYRFLRHPNYVGVAGELIGTALTAGAAVSGTLGSALFIGLMVLRTRIEKRALCAILRRG
jgi:methyltransferase